MTLKDSLRAARGTEVSGRSSPEGDDGWQPVVSRRRGAPPLRFKGRELVRVRPSRADDGASITLWMSKTSGYVAAVEVGALVDAVSSRTIEETMRWLEDLCHREQDGASRGNRGMPEIIDDAASRRCLRLLAGDALDRWDRLSETSAPQIA